MTQNNQNTSEEYVDTLSNVLNDYYEKDEKNFMSANEYFDYMVAHPDLFNTFGFNPVLVPEIINENIANGTYKKILSHKDDLDNVEVLLPDIFKGKGYKIGCDYKGIKDIKEKENNNTYIPSSNYCFAKCIMKFYDLKKINRTGALDDFKLLSPHAISLKKIRLELVNKMISCRFNCPSGSETNKYKTCSKECIKNKKERLMKLPFPQIFKVWFDRETNQVKRYLISKEKIIENQPFIGLLHIGGGEYHAILCKNKFLTKEDILVEFEQNTKLVCNTTRLSESSVPNLHDYVVAYDIETYTITKEELKYKNSKDKTTEIRKNLIPYALGYRVINLKTKINFNNNNNKIK